MFKLNDKVTYNGPKKRTNTQRHTIHPGTRCIVYGVSGDTLVLKENGTCSGYEGTVKVKASTVSRGW